MDKDERKEGAWDGEGEDGWMDGWMNEWTDGRMDGQMGARQLEGGMLHIGIDPQEGSSKIEWHLWRRWLHRPALSSRHRKLWHCQLCWENCGRSWLLLSHRHFLNISAGRRLRGHVSCSGWYTCSVFNKDSESEWNTAGVKPFIAPERISLAHVMSTYILKETHSIDNKVSSSCNELNLFNTFLMPLMLIYGNTKTDKCSVVIS